MAKGVKSDSDSKKLDKKSKSKRLENKEVEVIDFNIDSIDSVDSVDEIEEIDIPEDKKSVVEDILFKLPCVPDPLIGTPKQVQKKLDSMSIYIRRHPDDIVNNQKLFDKIHLYLHGFLINVALRQFPYIKGFQTVDIYQEALIALRFKAIPGFRRGKGMSFLNFAKMCIRRHLITILNTSKTRLKDQSINQAFSLDSCMAGFEGDEDGHSTFANIIPADGDSVDEQTAQKEAYKITLDNLCKTLSGFERQVLNEYLTSSSYTEIAHDIGRNVTEKCKTKSIDNALVRIRTKAQKLRDCGKLEDIPLFIV